MPKLLTLFASLCAFASKLLKDERGAVGDLEGAADAGGDQGGTDAGGDDAGAGSGDTGALETGGDATPAPAKPDWRVDKYGAEWETDHRYWKDTAGYWRQETDKEKKKRQASAKGIEDHDRAEPIQNRQPNANGQAKDDKGLDDVSTVKDLVDYWDKQAQSKFETILTEREKESNFRNSMSRAREDFAGGDGFPSFVELEQEVLIPLVESTPQVLQILRELPNAGPAAYTLALVLKAKTPDGLRKMFASQGYEELADKINETTKQAVRVKGGKGGPISTKLSPTDIANMKPAEFEKHVAKMTGSTA